MLNGGPMTLGDRYQDLLCWKLAVELQRLVEAQTARGSDSTNTRFCDQIRQQIASAIRQIEIGFAEYWPEHFADHLRLARSSLLAVHNSAALGFMNGHLSHADAGRIQQLGVRADRAAVELIRAGTAGTLGTLGTSGTSSAGSVSGRQRPSPTHARPLLR